MSIAIDNVENPPHNTRCSVFMQELPNVQKRCKSGRHKDWGYGNGRLIES